MIYEQLFAQIREKLSPNLSLVHEVSEALHISYDSAYRRIRGDKSLTIEEASTLCQQFDLSMDALLHITGSHVLFNAYSVEPEKFAGNAWLDYLFQHISKIGHAHNQTIIYAAKDPPIFNYLQFPEMVAFKFFFWSKTLFQIHDNEAQKFSLKTIDAEMVSKCNRISNITLKIPTIEIWNEDTFRIFIRQIEYYWVSGYFESKDDLMKLLATIETWLNHIQKQAEYGLMFRYGEAPEGIPNSYRLYENEVVLNDNSILVTTDGVHSVYLTYNVLGLLTSTNAGFCASIAQFHKVLMAKSNLISQTGEKERNRFFNKLHAIIGQFKEMHRI